MDARELEELAWKEFGEWCDQYDKDHPDHELDAYDLALPYGKEDKPNDT